VTYALLDEMKIIDLGWPRRLLTTSTVGYPSDSWASCLSVWHAVSGCADLTASGERGAPHWMERSGDTALFGCNTTSDTWRMKCDHNEWIGDRKNCTAIPVLGSHSSSLNQ